MCPADVLEQHALLPCHEPKTDDGEGKTNHVFCINPRLETDIPKKKLLFVDIADSVCFMLFCD
jgi:hypothetical protein